MSPIRVSTSVPLHAQSISRCARTEVSSMMMCSRSSKDDIGGLQDRLCDGGHCLFYEKKTVIEVGSRARE